MRAQFRVVTTMRWLAVLSPGVAFALGLGNILGDPIRTSVSTFDAAKAIAPMDDWGWVFMALGIFTVLTWFARQEWFAVALWANGLMHAWWATCFALAAMHDIHASMNAWVPYAGLTVMHFVGAQRVWVGQAHWRAALKR